MSRIRWRRSEAAPGVRYARHRGFSINVMPAKRGGGAVWGLFLAAGDGKPVGGWHRAPSMDAAQLEAEAFVARRYGHLLEPEPEPEPDEDPPASASASGSGLVPDCRDCRRLSDADGRARRCRPCAMRLLTRLELQARNANTRRRPRPAEGVGE